MRSSYLIATILAVQLGTGAPALAQDQRSGPVARTDISGSIGWFNAHEETVDISRYSNDWYNTSVFAGVTAGWYWTDNWKTEIEAGASSKAKLFGATTGFAGSVPYSIYSNYKFGTTRIAASQLYQGYRNVWFHPFVGLGIDVTWKTIDRTDDYFSGSPTRPPLVYPQRKEQLIRPFALAGFKAYMTPRTFWRTDIRMTFDGGPDEFLMRFAIGRDF